MDVTECNRVACQLNFEIQRGTQWEDRIDRLAFDRITDKNERLIALRPFRSFGTLTKERYSGWRFCRIEKGPEGSSLSLRLSIWSIRWILVGGKRVRWIDSWLRSFRAPGVIKLEGKDEEERERERKDPWSANKYPVRSLLSIQWRVFRVTCE